LTNARWKQLSAHRSAQTTLAHSNVLAMKDMNLMKMDLHVEVAKFNDRFELCIVTIIKWWRNNNQFNFMNNDHLKSNDQISVLRRIAQARRCLSTWTWFSISWKFCNTFRAWVLVHDPEIAVAMV